MRQRYRDKPCYIITLKNDITSAVIFKLQNVKYNIIKERRKEREMKDDSPIWIVGWGNNKKRAQRGPRRNRRDRGGKDALWRRRRRSLGLRHGRSVRSKEASHLLYFAKFTDSTHTLFSLYVCVYVIISFTDLIDKTGEITFFALPTNTTDIDDNKWKPSSHDLNHYFSSGYYNHTEKQRCLKILPSSILPNRPFH